MMCQITVWMWVLFKILTNINFDILFEIQVLIEFKLDF